MKCNEQVPPFGYFLSGTSDSLKNVINNVPMKSMNGSHYEKNNRCVCVCVRHHRVMCCD